MLVRHPAPGVGAAARTGDKQAALVPLKWARAPEARCRGLSDSIRTGTSINRHRHLVLGPGEVETRPAPAPSAGFRWQCM